MQFDADNLPKWAMRQNVGGSYEVTDEFGNQWFARLSERDATLICAAPGLLAFMGRFRVGHPCRVDVDRVLSRCGIELEGGYRDK